MADVIARRAVNIRSGQKLLLPAEVNLDPLTASLRLRIERPTALVTRGYMGAIRASILVDVNGERFHCWTTDTGGVRRIPADTNGRDAYDLSTSELIWSLPNGYFGGQELRRLGEGRTTFQAAVEIEALDGALDTFVALDSVVGAVPARVRHNSVAYDASSATITTTTGDLTVSHTASGSDRAAFVAAGGRRQGGTSGTYTLTYDTNSADGNLWNAQLNGTSWRDKADYFLEANVDTSAADVTVAESGDSGTLTAKALVVMSMTGVDQSTPVGTAVTGNASSGTTMSATVSTPASDSLVVDHWFSASNDVAGGQVEGANQTSREEQNTGVYFSAMSDQGGADGGAMTWTKNTFWEWGGGAVEFKAVAASGGNPKGPFGMPFHGPFSGHPLG